MKKKERYFIVFFRSNISNGYAVGHFDVITNGDYLSKYKTIEDIELANSLYSQTALTNIIELTPKEFKEWTEE